MGGPRVDLRGRRLAGPTQPAARSGRPSRSRKTARIRGLRRRRFRNSSRASCADRDREITLLFGVIGWALVWGGFTWLMYVSLEPYVRRVWPRTLISWTRLLSGYVRDPLVGRDVTDRDARGSPSGRPRHRSLSDQRPRRSCEHAHHDAREHGVHSPLHEHRPRVSSLERASVRPCRRVSGGADSLDRSQNVDCSRHRVAVSACRSCLEVPLRSAGSSSLWWPHCC